MGCPVFFDGVHGKVHGQVSSDGFCGNVLDVNAAGLSPGTVNSLVNQLVTNSTVNFAGNYFDPKGERDAACAAVNHCLWWVLESINHPVR